MSDPPLSDIDFKKISARIWTTLNPYCQILENSSRNFSKIFIFRVVTQTVYLENSSNFFSKFQFWGRELDRLPGKLIHSIFSIKSFMIWNVWSSRSILG